MKKRIFILPFVTTIRNKIMVKKYFETVTLFMILAFLSLTIFIIIAISHQPEELKSTLLYRLLLATLLFVAIDILLKQILKLTTAWLWITQIFLLVVAVYSWIIN